MAVPSSKDTSHTLFKTYYQLTKPGIIYANSMTATAGFLFASRLHITAQLLLALLAGIACVIASGCVFNNYIDRGIDRKMVRTKQRALASGEVPPAHAIVFGTALSIFGFFILSYTNWLVMLIGAIALLSYVVIYGLAKRATPYSTLIGTIPGAASLVAGYVAASNHFDWTATLLLLIMITWQMPHFYAIAIRRLDDYRAAKLPVWPATYGITNTKKQILVYIAAFIGANLLVSLLGYAGYSYAVVMTGIGVYWFWRGLHGFREANAAKWAGRMFGLSLIVLLTFSVMLSVGRLLP